MALYSSFVLLRQEDTGPIILNFLCQDVAGYPSTSWHFAFAATPILNLH